MHYKKINDITEIITTNNTVYTSPKVFITKENIRRNFILKRPVVEGKTLPSKIVSNLQENDILICKLENIDDVILIDNTTKDYVFSSDFVVIRAKEIDYKYLYFYLISDRFKKNKRELLTGINKRILKISSLKSLEIPIIDKNEDFYEIEKEHHTYHRNLSKIRNVLKNNREKLHSICMYYLMGKNLKDVEFEKNEFLSFKTPKSWKVERLKGVSTRIIEGQKKNLRYIEKGVPVLFSNNIIDKGLDLKGVKFISEQDSKFLNSNLQPEKHDILMSSKNGYTYLINSDYTINVSEGVIMIKPNPEYVIPEYLFLLLNSLYIKKYIKFKLNFIDSSNIENIFVPIPSLEEQAEILEITTNYIQQNENIIKKVRQKIKKEEDNLNNKINEYFSF